jgi:hypothetical protein
VIDMPGANAENRLMDTRFFAVAGPEGETYINIAHITALGKVRPRAAFGEKNNSWAIEMRLLGTADQKFEPIGHFSSENDAEIRLGDLIKTALTTHSHAFS